MLPVVLDSNRSYVAIFLLSTNEIIITVLFIGILQIVDQQTDYLTDERAEPYHNM